MVSKDSIIRVAKEFGIHYVGIASLERFSNAPPGHRPQDLLPTTRAIISLGIKIGRGVRAAQNQAYEKKLSHMLCVYMVYGYPFLNSLLQNAAYFVARFLEENGFVSVPIPPSRPIDMEKLMGVISNRHAAVAAGIGEFGWNGLLVTPEVGPRVRVATVLTEANLKPDPLYSGERICKPEKCKYACIASCPLEAFDQGQTLTCHIGEKQISYFKLSKWKCILGSYGLRKEVLSETDALLPDVPTYETYLEARSLANKRGGEKPGSCGMCIITCPVGDSE